MLGSSRYAGVFCLSLPRPSHHGFFLYSFSARVLRDHGPPMLIFLCSFFPSMLVPFCPQHVLQHTGADARSTVFVDDKLVNVDAARSLGIHGIVWDTSANVKRALLDIVDSFSPPSSPLPVTPTTPTFLHVQPSAPISISDESGHSFPVKSAGPFSSFEPKLDVGFKRMWAWVRRRSHWRLRQ